MSNIPATAVAAAFTPVHRATNDALRARRVQSQKDSHHNEDVEELDDTAVDSVRDQQQRHQGSEGNPKKEQPGEGEHVDIEALKEVQLTPTSPDAPETTLDISA